MQFEICTINVFCGETETANQTPNNLKYNSVKNIIHLMRMNYQAFLNCKMPYLKISKCVQISFVYYFLWNYISEFLQQIYSLKKITTAKQIWNKVIFLILELFDSVTQILTVLKSAKKIYENKSNI